MPKIYISIAIKIRWNDLSWNSAFDQMVFSPVMPYWPLLEYPWRRRGRRSGPIELILRARPNGKGYRPETKRRLLRQVCGTFLEASLWDILWGKSVGHSLGQVYGTFFGATQIVFVSKVLEWANSARNAIKKIFPLTPLWPLRKFFTISWYHTILTQCFWLRTLRMG